MVATRSRVNLRTRLRLRWYINAGRDITGNTTGHRQDWHSHSLENGCMKRHLPFAIIFTVFLAAVGAGALLFHFRQPPQQQPTQQQPPQQPPPTGPVFGKSGAEPPHVRGPANAPVVLEEFGDFECLPCFMLWPAMKNIEKDYAQSLSVTFREHPLAQHHHALEAARAAEAAGLQGRFWEMHDLLYLRRSAWIREEDVRAFFKACASELGLDLERFLKDMDGEEVTRRIAADDDRGASLGIDRTPTVFINGKKVELSPQPEQGLRAEIDAALGPRVR
jgi:protein-disulfide isomerase